MLLHGQKPSAKVRMVFFLTSLAYTQVFVEKHSHPAFSEGAMRSSINGFG